MGLFSNEGQGLLRVTLAKSTNKKLQSHRACVRGLGLRRIGHTVELEPKREILGMINKVRYLLKVEKVEEVL